MSVSGSIGRSESKRIPSSELGRYTEDDDEDYDDIFAKPNDSSKRFLVK
jgi:hypothetical protein